MEGKKSKDTKGKPVPVKQRPSFKPRLNEDEVRNLIKKYFKSNSNNHTEGKKYEFRSK